MNYSPAISSVTFVPAQSFSGTVTLTYTGINVGGQSFSGTVVIKVTGPISDLTYTSVKSEPVQFKSADFNSISTAATGIALNYVRFSLPAASYGMLYYNYVSASNPGTPVTASTSYYMYGEPYLDRIFFVPSANTSGNVPITYTASDMSGQSYSGNIVITVTGQTSGSSNFTDVDASYAWAAEAIDYLYGLGVVNGTGGKLFSPGNATTRCDFLLMLYRLTGLRSSSKVNFSDVPKDAYYFDAVATAKALGIAVGTNNMIYPTSLVTRQDALLWIYRALLVSGITVPAGSAGDIAGFSDKNAISSYALEAVQALVKAEIVKGSGGKLNPTGSLSRAEMCVLLYRVDKAFLKHG